MRKRGKNRLILSSLGVKSAAFSEIFILVVATFAFCFVIGGSGRVSANPGDGYIIYQQAEGAGFWARTFNAGATKYEYRVLENKVVVYRTGDNDAWHLSEKWTETDLDKAQQRGTASRTWTNQNPKTDAEYYKNIDEEAKGRILAAAGTPAGSQTADVAASTTTSTTVKGTQTAQSSTGATTTAPTTPAAPVVPATITKQVTETTPFTQTQIESQKLSNIAPGYVLDGKTVKTAEYDPKYDTMTVTYTDGTKTDPFTAASEVSLAALYDKAGIATTRTVTVPNPDAPAPQPAPGATPGTPGATPPGTPGATPPKEGETPPAAKLPGASTPKTTSPFGTQVQRVYTGIGSSELIDVKEGDKIDPDNIMKIEGQEGGTTKVEMRDGTTRTLTEAGATLLKKEMTKQGIETATEYKSMQPWASGLGPGMAHFVDGLALAGTLYAGGQLIGGMFGFSPKQKQALSMSLAAGGLTYQWIQAAGPGGAQLKMFNWVTPTNAFMIGLAVAAVMFAMTYKKEKLVTFKFTCKPWQPPLGGAKCEQCNKDPFRPCSEYRCKALGQACELKNKDSPGKEMCVWVAKDDVSSPKITTWSDALSPSGLKYIPDTTRPPALGAKIVRTGENPCLQAFTALQFGLTTDEPSQCRVSLNHTKNISQMEYEFGETNLFLYNHTQIMKLPGPYIFAETGNETTATTGSPLFKNDGTTTLFIRCMDANGNQNVDEFAVTFCVDKSPDTTPPLVEGTSITSEGFVQYNIESTLIDVYVNEPAECKWSIQSKAWEDMENSMACTTDPTEINAGLTYTCTGNITGIKDNEVNKYYFRCKDQPDAESNVRNVMTQSYELILKGSQPLNIISVSPNETIYGSTDDVNVELTLETSAGAEEGKAQCLFSNTGDNESYVAMFETNSFLHRQLLQLPSGEYTYYFKCLDLGGNADYEQTSFKVVADKDAPQVARIYNEEGMGLKVVTNEDAECTYSLTTCNFVFDDAKAAGLKLVYASDANKKSSYAEWKPNTVYYIKCRDFFNNEPNPNECSVIAGIMPQTNNE